jgi:hypothetical protein
LLELILTRICGTEISDLGFSKEDLLAMVMVEAQRRLKVKGEGANSEAADVDEPTQGRTTNGTEREQ